MSISLNFYRGKETNGEGLIEIQDVIEVLEATTSICTHVDNMLSVEENKSALDTLVSSMSNTTNKLKSLQSEVSALASWLQHLAPKCEFASSNFRWVPPKRRLTGHYINMQHCGGLPMVFLQLRDPLELFIKRMEFLPGSKLRSYCDMT